MDRRDFFRRSIGKATEVAVKAADKRVTDRAKHWIRPPYAIPELDFLLACTRCNACIDVCPHNVIFPLAARLGADVASTPALDLLKKGCQLCEGWACVAACEPKALAFPEANEEGEISLPELAIATINTEACLPYSGPECGACNDACPLEDALVFEREKPSINAEFCIGCGLCREACIVDGKAINIKPI